MVGAQEMLLSLNHFITVDASKGGMIHFFSLRCSVLSEFLNIWHFSALRCKFSSTLHLAWELLASV